MTSINCKGIKKEVKKIKVQKFDDVDVSLENNSSLELIGKGRQGAVFKINEEMCIKVYGEVKDCQREYYAMNLGKDTPLLPNVYCKGDNFIVMEMVYGIDLREYLQASPLTKELSYKLIEMLITFKEIGFERIDHHKRQIYLQKDGTLKVIDVGRTVWRNRTYPYPRKLLQSLGTENKQLFLTHVQEMAPPLYEEWQYFMKMDEIAREMYHHLNENAKIDIESLHENANNLLTKKSSKEHIQQLLGLIRKVVKEERVALAEKEQKSKEKAQKKENDVEEKNEEKESIKTENEQKIEVVQEEIREENGKQISYRINWKKE